MAATTAGAIKAYLEGLSFGVPVFRDGPRPGQEPPYIVVQEAMPITADPRGCGDFGDPAAELTVTEIVNVDLIQQARLKTGPAGTRNTERYGLAEAIAHALHGCALPAHPARVHGVIVQSTDRIPIADNLVRHSTTLAVRRVLLTAEVIPA